MKKSRDKDSFVNKPEFPGGKSGLAKFVREHLKYPKEALENKIEGKVFLSFKVDFDGTIKDVKVINGLGYGCDEEACRIIRLMKFTEAKNKGSKVSIQRKLAVHFKLPKPKPQKQTPNIQYTYVAKKEENSKNGTYSYKIDLDW